MIMVCKYPGCTAVVTPSGRGRPPSYCPEHNSRAARHRATRHAGQLAALLAGGRQCCADAVAANPRKRKCDQCRQWRRFLKDSRSRAFTARDVGEWAEQLAAWGADPTGNRGFRLATSDTYLPESAADRKAHKLEDAWLDSVSGHEGERISEGGMSPDDETKGAGSGAEDPG